MRQAYKLVVIAFLNGNQLLKFVTLMIEFGGHLLYTAY